MSTDFEMTPSPVLFVLGTVCVLVSLAPFAALIWAVARKGRENRRP